MRKGDRMKESIMTTTTIDNIWRYGPGVRVNYKSKWYVYVGRLDDGVERLVEESTGIELIDEIDYEEDVYVDLTPNVEWLVGWKTREVLQLIDEGWVDDPTSKYMNIRPEIDALRMYKEVEKITTEIK